VSKFVFVMVLCTTAIFRSDESLSLPLRKRRVAAEACATIGHAIATLSADRVRLEGNPRGRLSGKEPRVRETRSETAGERKNRIGTSAPTAG